MSESGTADDELVAHWQSIRVGTAAVQHRLDEAVEAEGVPAQWFAVLHMLLAAPDHGLPMTVLARDLAMTSGGFTKLVDRMAKDGLLDRRGNATDRRVVHAALTEQGRNSARRAERVYLETLRESLLTHVRLADLAAASNTLDALSRAHLDAAALEAAALQDPALLTTHRDPALPERRGRGRVSD
ncbi:MarR family winged helix-turn-helix transcriptional regulator [uncultured Jatrophihabitans sp.]|uniref:MarR family winged helix-turn-helix transcriptional regulator n=1 Tax=uncultured Jatrophihabitans sp. TaxID=1610747 RepID=UPI0035CACA5D